MSLIDKLQQLHLAHERYCLDATQQMPQIYHDPDWPSECERGEVNSLGEIAWQAVKRGDIGSLEKLAQALECQFPDDLSDFYGGFYAGNVEAFFDGKKIELLQAWNDEDFARLQQNITGHVLMKRRLKQPDTVFIGLTEQEDLLISVDISSGEVGLEFVGKKQHHILASSLSAFIEQLLTQYPN
ncbi:SecY-interacting protein [Pseudoalteromonas sp. T1lg65]|uniref:SecY-interacting protein n=1 Tax=Pseudoalteromonas sp. T1lg65 TaxID=2077101 RepID=UPI003F7A9FEB